MLLSTSHCELEPCLVGDWERGGLRVAWGVGITTGWGETEVFMEVSSRRLAIVQHRHPPARGLLSLIRLLRAFLLTGIKWNQVQRTPTRTNRGKESRCTPEEGQRARTADHAPQRDKQCRREPAGRACLGLQGTRRRAPLHLPAAGGGGYDDVAWPLIERAHGGEREPTPGFYVPFVPCATRTPQPRSLTALSSPSAFRRSPPPSRSGRPFF